MPHELTGYTLYYRGKREQALKVAEACRKQDYDVAYRENVKDGVVYRKRRIKWTTGKCPT